MISLLPVAVMKMSISPTTSSIVVNVAHDSVVLHLLHVLHHDDILVAGSRDEDVDLTNNVLNRGHLVALHASLERVDRIDLRHHDAGARALERRRAALADVTEAAHERALAAEHHIRSTHDAVRERVAA